MNVHDSIIHYGPKMGGGPSIDGPQISTSNSGIMKKCVNVLNTTVNKKAKVGTSQTLISE